MHIVKEQTAFLSSFSPGELEAITGLSVVLIRDWRRRKIIRDELERGPAGFELPAVAELMVLSHLTQHGLGPKTVFGWTRAMAVRIVQRALSNVDAWASEEEWRTYLEKYPAEEPARRFVVLASAPYGVTFWPDPSAAFRDGRALGTVLDLDTFGDLLRERSGKPLAKMVFSGVFTEVEA